MIADPLDVSESLRERNIARRSLTEHIDAGTPASKMLYAVLGAVAQVEREVLRERIVAGMHAANIRGELIGRPPALTPLQIREAKKMLEHGESANHAARIFRVGCSTPYRVRSQSDFTGSLRPPFSHLELKPAKLQRPGRFAQAFAPIRRAYQETAFS